MKRAAVYSIVAFWLVMAALFVRREVIPNLYAQPGPGYAAVRAYALSHAGYRMGIYGPDAARIGSAETTYDLRPDGDCRIASTVSINFEKHTLFSLVPGGRNAARQAKAEIRSEVTVGPDNALKSVSISCDGGGMSASAQGIVVGDSLQISVNLGGVRSERTIPVSRDDVVSGGLIDVGALPNLREGQTWQIKVLDPFSLRFSAVTVTVKEKTRILLRGHWYPVYEVETPPGMAASRVWVSPSGDVLKEETKVGPVQVVMIREPLPHEMTGAPAGAFTTRPARN